MTVCTRLVWYIEFHVLWNGVWNVRFVFCLWMAHTTHSPPPLLPLPPPPAPPHSLSFGHWHIQLTNAQYMATLRYYPILSTACRRDGTSHVIWRGFLLVSVSHQKHTCWEDILSINLPYLPLKTLFISLQLIGILITLESAHKHVRACVFPCM